ncbi:SAVED domain-containing protein, partial [Paraburkholderia bryophila]
PRHPPNNPQSWSNGWVRIQCKSRVRIPCKSTTCGQHAFDLAEALALQINQNRIQSRPALHLFIAAPNAFTFFFGQRQPGLGKATLYEYDFEGTNGGGYTPSLSLPI